MLSFQEAQEIIIKHAQSFGEELVDINDVYGRVLAEAIKADRDYPPFNRASMDGYAIKKSDWDNGLHEFIIAETIYAGNISKHIIKPGECYKIMTGAAVPVHADAVIRREDVSETQNSITVLHPIAIGSELKSFQNIAKQGEDIQKDFLIIERNVKCTAPVIGLLASLGKSKVLVKKLPTVAVITTGDEVVDVADKVDPVQIRNSNAYTIKALLKQWNIIPSSVNHVPDDIGQLLLAITAAKKNDVIILSGGVSAGDADYVPSVLKESGAMEIFHKVAIKPGRPFWFGKFANGAVVFGLPGNPLSCMVTVKLFIELFLSCSFGLDKPQQLSLPFKGTRMKKSSLDEFFPVKISGNPSSIEPIHFNGSGDITALIKADGIARHPNDVAALTPGTIVELYRLG
jgi:molybdopterin molybdotransferase